MGWPVSFLKFLSTVKPAVPETEQKHRNFVASQESNCTFHVRFGRLKVAIWRSLVNGAVGLFPLENYPEDLSVGTAEGGQLWKGVLV